MKWSGRARAASKRVSWRCGTELEQVIYLVALRDGKLGHVLAVDSGEEGRSAPGGSRLGEGEGGHAIGC